MAGWDGGVKRAEGEEREQVDSSVGADEGEDGKVGVYTALSDAAG